MKLGFNGGSMSHNPSSKAKEVSGSQATKNITDWVSAVLGNRPGSMALPFLTGPARGLWFREQSEQATLHSGWNSISKLCREGWTVWDCGGHEGLSTLLYSRFVGQDGLVVSFEPKRDRFIATYENATLNGCNNILFLFSELGATAAPKSFGPPVAARKISLDEAYADEEIPIPQVIQLELGANARDVLGGGRRLFHEKRPILVVHRYSTEALKHAVEFAERHNYSFRTLEDDKEIKNLSELKDKAFVCLPK